MIVLDKKKNDNNTNMNLYNNNSFIHNCSL